MNRLIITGILATILCLPNVVISQELQINLGEFDATERMEEKLRATFKARGCTTSFCVGGLPTNPICERKPHECSKSFNPGIITSANSLQDLGVFNQVQPEITKKIVRVNRIKSRMLDVKEEVSEATAKSTQIQFCDSNIDADIFSTCRYPVVGVVDGRLNFAGGTAIVIDEYFAITARHVAIDLHTRKDGCKHENAPFKKNNFISTKRDLTNGANDRVAKYPITCITHNPDPKIDISLLRIFPMDPPWRGLRYKILDHQDAAKIDVDTPNYLTGYGVFGKSKNECSAKPHAGQRKIGVAKSTACLADNCTNGIDFEVVHTATDVINSDICVADSGGAIMLEMGDQIQTEGRFALKGVILRKPVIEGLCNSRNIAVDLSSPKVQNWVIENIARINGEQPDIVRDRIIHKSDPRLDVTYDDAIQTLIEVDKITNDCS